MSSITNSGLVARLVTSGVIISRSVEQAMLSVDRKNFCLPTVPAEDAYADRPLGIGFRATISAPHMHAHALNQLEYYLSPGSKVLDVGCGSGYLAAAMSRMVGPSGRVIGIDFLQPLVDFSLANVRKNDADLLKSGVLEIRQGDGWKGDVTNGPYDAIHVGAAAETIPMKLVEQLKAPGRMVIPVGTELQDLLAIDKDISGQVTINRLMSVIYVPLVKLSDSDRLELGMK